MSNAITVINDITEEMYPTIYVKGGLAPFIEAVKVEVSHEVPDITTRKGRDRIASLAAKVSKSKVAVEKPGRDYLRSIKELPKTIEAELREFVQQMDALRDEIRRPLTEWEEAEKSRVSTLEFRVQQLRDLALVKDGASAAGIEVQIFNLESAKVDESWEEFETEAHRIKTTSLAALRETLAARQKYETEQAELERLRAEAAQREQREREERIAREAAEQARALAEQKAQAVLQAAAKREADAQAAVERARLDAELAEQRQIAAEQKAELDRQAAIERERIAAEKAEQQRIQAELMAVAAERQRQADEQARIEREAAAREADKAHKKTINNEALAAFIAGGMPEEFAKQAVTLIAQRKIPYVSISY